MSVQGGSGGVAQAVNQTQINGSATPTGAGVASTAGTQRVVAAQDTTTIAGSAPGTAGTPSANVITVQGVSGGTAQPVSVASGANVVEGATSDTSSTNTMFGNLQAIKSAGALQADLLTQ